MSIKGGNELNACSEGESHGWIRCTEQQCPGSEQPCPDGRGTISYLRVHSSTIYRMLKKNQLPAFRVGGDWRFTVEAIDKWRAAVESGASLPLSNNRLSFK